MNNIILALTKKRTALYTRKREVQEDAKRMIRDIDAKIADVDKALKTLNDAVADYLCPQCKGTGFTRATDAAGQMEDVNCTACHGTGVKV